MNILAIETSTEACTVAIRYNNQVLERFEIEPRAHSLLVLPMIDSLLSEAGISKQQLDLIAFGCGPGAFTGVRIAASVTQGIAFAVDIPVVAVSTLLALAQGAYRRFGLRQILPVLDARMDEVYITECTLGADGIMHAGKSEIVVAPQNVVLPETGHWLGAGSGWDRYYSVLLAQQHSSVTWEQGCLPRAQDTALIGQSMAEQGKLLTPEQAIPVYIRNKVATRPH